MYTTRLLPLGAPVAAGVSTTAHGAVVVLSLLGMLALSLISRAILLRRNHADDTAGGGRG